MWDGTLAGVADEPASLNDLFSEDEIAALRAAPAETVVGNHVFHLLELATIHLSAEPANFDEAQLCIDAVGGLMDAIGERLGEHGPLLAQALAQVRLAYVDVTALQRGESS
jgi:hypothetical protein